MNSGDTPSFRLAPVSQGRHYVILCNAHVSVISDWEGCGSGMSFDMKPGIALQPHSISVTGRLGKVKIFGPPMPAPDSP
jgi:hypothetical protein